MTSMTRFKRTRMQCYKQVNKKKCGHRFALKKPPHEYKRKITCPLCGSDKVMNVEATRRREIDKQERCYCNPIPFPHKKGSPRMCIEHPLNILGVAANDEEWEQYEHMLLTKREFQK